MLQDFVFFVYISVIEPAVIELAAVTGLSRSVGEPAAVIELAAVTEPVEMDASLYLRHLTSKKIMKSVL